MYKRALSPPEYSFFLFGPRATGKTTWLRHALSDARWYNLLEEDEFYRLSSNPDELLGELLSVENKWVVIDEVQRIPKLLNIVHNAISQGVKCKFAISGSSARKLKDLNANLLAGRLIRKYFFPLTALELGNDFDLEFVIKYGTLPDVCLKKEFAEQILDSYTKVYLAEEIQREANVKDIGHFLRFLKVAAILNGQVVNYSNISRDAGVKRKTVESFFHILSDTLIGFFLPAWQKKARVKQLSAPRFYFFDCGVVRALSNELGLPVVEEKKGFLFETFILNEVRFAMNKMKVPGELSYFRTSSGAEVDLIWSYGDCHIGFEIKSGKKWKSNFSRSLNALKRDGHIQKAYGVYTGKYSLKSGHVEVLNLSEFLKKLHNRELLNYIKP